MLKRFWLRRISAVLVFALLLSIIPSGIFAAEGTAQESAVTVLSDTYSSYAKEEIQALVDKGVISGFGDGTFKPKQSMTRAELAKVIVLSMGLQANASYASSFTDVKESDWFAGYVGALVNSGITQGTSSTTFAPNLNVTREELAVFFVRAFGWEDKAAGEELDVNLTDIEQASSWAQSSVALAYSIGFIKGIENADGSYQFNPKGQADRQALARLAYEFLFNKAVYAAELETLGAGNAQETTTAGNTSSSSSKGSKDKDKDKDSDKDDDDSSPDPGTTDPGTTDPSDSHVINVAGDYSFGAVEGSVTVNVPGVTLSDTAISGDLLLAEGIGEGEVYLDGVTVEGETKVLGGGVNSIHVQNSVLATVIVDKVDGSIRLVLESGTDVQQIMLRSGAVLETSNGVGNIGSIDITEDLPQNASVTLKGTFNNVRVHAAQAQITIPDGVSIGNLEIFEEAIGTVFHLENGATVRNAIINAIVSFVGQGEIESCQLNVDGTTFERETSSYEADPSIINAVYSPHAMSLSAVEATYQIAVAGMKEDNSYVNLTQVTAWSSSDESVAEVAGGLVKSTGEGNALITGIYGDLLVEVPVTVSVYQQSDYPVISGVEVTNGMIQVEFEGEVDGETLADFNVSATLDGIEVALDGLQYNSADNTFTFEPVQNYGRTLYVTVEANADKTKFAGSQSGSIRLTGFGGTIGDVNGNPVAGLEIKFRKGLNATEGDIAGIATTDSNGNYFIYLAPGIYTGELGGEGTRYVTTYLIGVAAANVRNEWEDQTAIGIPAESETRIVLTWGKDPSDLDSHLIGPAVDGQDGQFHTWYVDKTYTTENGLIVDLDLDDTSSYGPETTTIRQDTDGTYTFYVHHYYGSATIKTSGAKIEVYRGASTTPAEVYEVEAGSGDERYWIVFQMVVEDGVATFNEINEFTNVSPASGVYVNNYYYNYSETESDEDGEETEEIVEDTVG